MDDRCWLESGRLYAQVPEADSHASYQGLQADSASNDRSSRSWPTDGKRAGQRLYRLRSDLQGRPEHRDSALLCGGGRTLRGSSTGGGEGRLPVFGELLVERSASN